MGIIVWVDTESTGTDEFRDPLLEVALIVTTKQLTEITRASWIIRPPHPLDAYPMVDEVREMHKRNGLLDLVATEGIPIGDVDAEMAQVLQGSNPTANHKVPLGGSGVGHFDRRFIGRQMPKVDRLLTYWCYDIGNVRRFGRIAKIEAPAVHADADRKSHRAMDDIEMHLAEARWWLRFLRRAKENGTLRDVNADDLRDEDDADRPA